MQPPEPISHRPGLLGIFASAAGLGTSYLPQVEIWLRLASLSVGLAVAVLTLANLWRNLRRDKNK